MDKLLKMNNLMFDLNTEVHAISQSLLLFQDLLFEGQKPNPTYQYNYEPLQQMFWLIADRLHSFDGKFSLLMGEDGNQHTEYEREQLDTLYQRDKWWGNVAERRNRA